MCVCEREREREREREIQIEWVDRQSEKVYEKERKMIQESGEKEEFETDWNWDSTEDRKKDKV